MKFPKPIRCTDVGNREVLSALLMHELEVDDEDVVLAHLRKCPACLSMAAIVIEKEKIAERHSGTDI